jgi:hypothetical protein
MGILLNLVGVVLASAFLLYMAFYLNELPLYVVCFLGIGVICFAFWQDEIQGEASSQADGVEPPSTPLATGRD